MGDRSAESEIAALSETYAAAADRADGDAVASLFVPDGKMVVEPPAPAEPQVLAGRAAIAERIGALRRYDRTSHDVGRSTVEVAGRQAHGTTECVAHHIGGEAGEGVDRVVVLTYFDTYTVSGGSWSFLERVVRMHSETYEPVADS